MFDHSLNMLPPGPGVGYKAQHIAHIMENAAPVSWLEIHAENYMGEGGRPLAQLRLLAEHFPISVHGVGLSIGGEQKLDPDHLKRLKKLCDWLNPASFSEHLAWSTHEGAFLNDLLPLPYNKQTLANVVDHVSQVQDVLGRKMLLENPSAYVSFSLTDMDEVDFLSEVAARSGCGLLLDVNNVYVECSNQSWDADDYINRFPHHLVGEIHLGGYAVDEADYGMPLLIDAHCTEVSDPVWDLYAKTIAKGGAKPTLIEWDNDVPEWPVLAEEATRALRILETVA